VTLAQGSGLVLRIAGNQGEELLHWKQSPYRSAMAYNGKPKARRPPCLICEQTEKTVDFVAALRYNPSFREARQKYGLKKVDK